MTKNKPAFTARLTRERSQRFDVLVALTGETKNALFNRAIEALLLQYGIEPTKVVPSSVTQIDQPQAS
jgi:hypothetical protein